MLFKNRVQIAWPWKTSNPSPRGSGSTPRSMQKHVKQYGCFLTMARSSSRKTIVFEQNLCFILVVTTVLQNTTRGYECRKSPGSKPCSHLSSCERWSTVFVWLEVIRIWWVYYIIYIYISTPSPWSFWLSVVLFPQQNSAKHTCECSISNKRCSPHASYFGPQLDQETL